MYTCPSVRKEHTQLCIFAKRVNNEITCTFINNTCLPITKQCKYTNKENNETKVCEYIVTIDEKEYCKAYMSPESAWYKGKCPLETHLPRAVQKQTIVLDPRKAAKQRRRKG